MVSFDRRIVALPGIQDTASRNCLVEQLIESLRRIRYVSVLRQRDLSPRRADPSSPLFDPLQAAVLHQRAGRIDESFWLVFLFVHFGKHAKGGWRYAREVYGRLGEATFWDWKQVSTNPAAFRAWLDAHQQDLKREGAPGGFGNHRKRQSLDAYTAVGTGAAVEGYVRWVAPPRTHQALVDEVLTGAAGGDAHKAFDELYRSLDSVPSFGRLARFDYLCMVGKLGLAPIEPGSVYLGQSTGPLKGARLLFSGQEAAILSPAYLDQRLTELGRSLDVGMQALEDALCNWHKSPTEFTRFRG